MTQLSSAKSLNDIKSLIESQDYMNAENHLKALLEGNPKESEAYFLQGKVAQKQAKWEEAVGYYKQAYHLQPFHSGYVLALSNCLTQSGDLQAAVSILQGYLGVDKSNAEVQFQLGLLLTQLKQWQGAFEALQSALNLDQTKISYYMAFGHLLYLINRPQDALKVYLSAYAKGLKSEGLFQNIAKLSTDFGELEQAKAMLKEAAELYPTSLSFIYRLHALDSSCLSEELRSNLEGQASSTENSEDLFYIHWLLSKYAAQAGDIGKEIELLEKAHQHYLAFANFVFDKQLYLDTLNKFRLTDTLTKSLSSQQTADSTAPIFIVGVPRCGSTLIENIIHAGHRDVKKGEETSALFHAVSGLLKAGQIVVDGIELNTIKDTVTKIYHGYKLLEPNVRFTDKSLENIFLIDLILAIYPNAKIIYCDRNPLASILSILKNNLATLPWAHNLDDIFAYVDKCLSSIERFKNKYPSKILSIKYEELVSDPESESKKIMAFCELDWTPDCLNIHEHKVHSETASHIQIREAINTKAVDKHLAYKDILKSYSQKYSW